MNDFKLYGRNDRKIELQVHTVRISSVDIRMQYRMEKCAIIKLQHGKVKHTEGIVLLIAQVIREVKEDGYNYLILLETNQIDPIAEFFYGQTPTDTFFRLRSG